MLPQFAREAKPEKKRLTLKPPNSPAFTRNNQEMSVVFALRKSALKPDVGAWCPHEQVRFLHLATRKPGPPRADPFNVAAQLARCLLFRGRHSDRLCHAGMVGDPSPPAPHPNPLLLCNIRHLRRQNGPLISRTAIRQSGFAYPSNCIASASAVT